MQQFLRFGWHLEVTHRVYMSSSFGIDSHFVERFDLQNHQHFQENATKRLQKIDPRIHDRHQLRQIILFV